MNTHVDPSALEADLVRMWDAGLTQTEIGARLDASRRSTARRIAALREKGLLRDRPVYTHPRQQRVKKLRPCMCCSTPFKSEGIGNRLCVRCRHRSEAFDL